MPKSAHFEKVIIFDTPGHAAFTGMRQRGAHVVDLAILMVSATDGIQEQTRESLAYVSTLALIPKIEHEIAYDDNILFVYMCVCVFSASFAKSTSLS